ncbi:MAG: hypothetical protein AB1349_13200, partial [Elusimicrobiota bacterium]
MRKKTKFSWIIILLIVQIAFMLATLPAITLKEVLSRLNAGKTWGEHAKIWGNAIARAVGGKVATSDFLPKFLLGTGIAQTALTEKTSIRGWSVWATATGLSKLGPKGIAAATALRVGYPYYKNWVRFPPPPPPPPDIPDDPGKDIPDEYYGVSSTEVGYDVFTDVFINIGNFVFGSIPYNESYNAQIERVHSKILSENPEYENHLLDLEQKSEQAYIAATAVQDKVMLLSGTTYFPYFKSVDEVNNFLNGLTLEQRTEINNLNQQYKEKLMVFDKSAEVILNDHRKAYDAIILRNGYWDEASKLLNAVFIPNASVNIDEDWSNYKTLVIPSGGFYGLDGSVSFKKKLAEYVSNGGTVIIFSQQKGYEYSVLPNSLKAYGWTEDQSCHSNAVYISTYHPMFAGQIDSTPDMNVDGYFTNYPANAKVLLRRTKNNMPCLIEYTVKGREVEGRQVEGRVIATTFYSDFSYAQGSLSQEEKTLIQNLLAYAKDPTTPATQQLRAIPYTGISFTLNTPEQTLIQGQRSVVYANVFNETAEQKTVIVKIAEGHGLVASEPKWEKSWWYEPTES